MALIDVLILGGTGFLGRHLVEAALGEGHRVTLFNRGLTEPGLFPEVEKIEGELGPAVVAALEFADAEARRAFWESPEYAAVKGLRHRSTRSKVLFADTP